MPTSYKQYQDRLKQLKMDADDLYADLDEDADEDETIFSSTILSDLGDAINSIELARYAASSWH